MKIEIDLKQILSDEYGDGENLAESIQRQITENLTATLKAGIEKKVNEDIAMLIDKQIKVVIANQMPSLTEELMNAEYLPVDKWGNVQKETTTVRKELVKSIHAEMRFRIVLIVKQTKGESNEKIIVSACFPGFRRCYCCG